jgi:hypothetical protein
MGSMSVSFCSKYRIAVAPECPRKAPGSERLRLRVESPAWGHSALFTLVGYLELGRKA